MPDAGAPRAKPFRRFTMRFVNPVTRLLAGWLPGFAVITCRGRRSGRTYHTPMNLFRRGNDYVFALTYGADVQWVKNVLASGELQAKTMGRTIRLADPQLFEDPERRLMPLPVRLFLGLARVKDFLRMRRVDPGQ
jgi:deazaflavin-dependent oxidoreductase (nitroreductase family)